MIRRRSHKGGRVRGEGRGRRRMKMTQRERDGKEEAL